jgi:hypothetical protein
MAFDFPANPVNGQKFTSGNNTYVWNGYGWMSEPPTAYVKIKGDQMTGALGIRTLGSTGHLLLDNTTAADQVPIVMSKNNLKRWTFGTGPGPEPGGDANSDFHFRRFSDAGVIYPDIPLKITRKTGRAQVAQTPVDPLDIATKQYVDATMGGGGPEHVLRGGDIMTGPLTLPTMVVNAVPGGQSDIYGQNGGVSRWLIRMTDNFELHRYSDVGAYLGSPLQINRTTGNANFVGQVAAGNFWSATGYLSNLSSDNASIGNCSSGGTFSLNAVNCAAFSATSILDYGNLTVNGHSYLTNASINGGNIFMRGDVNHYSHIYMRYNNDAELTTLRSVDTFSPAHVGGVFNIMRANNGMTSLTVFGSGATFSSYGYNGKAGIYGGPQPNCWNFEWQDQVGLHGWIDNTHLGVVVFNSDYRIKRNVEPLPSVWGQVKALRPVKYNMADYTPTSPKARLKDKSNINGVEEEIPDVKMPPPVPLFKADDVEHWGFIAHELQETLIKDAATGEKDAPDLVQSPNPWTMIAALTKTLQEAMARIEYLEGRMGVSQ